MYFENISDLNSTVSVDSLSYMRLARDFGTFDDWQKDFIACGPKVTMAPSHAPTQDPTDLPTQKPTVRNVSEPKAIVQKSTEKGQAVPDEWQTYRQALRDLPAHKNWPNLEETDWPTRPS